MPAATIPEAIDAYRAGRFVIIVDDADRENEGDLAIAAEAVTPEAITFMARHASGLICVPMQGEALDRLGLPMMVPPNRNGTRYGTAFTVSVEAREGVTTGISAHDRARTIQALTDPASRPDDLVQPGHVFPLRAHPGGVLARAGQTEASVELAQLAGMQPAAVICEIMDDDGTMARMPALERFSARHDIPIVTIADLIAYLKAQGAADDRIITHDTRTVRRLLDVPLPTRSGPFSIHAFADTSRPDAEPHLAIVAGNVLGSDPVLTRVHSECLTGDVFGSSRCDCGRQLNMALERITAEGRGVLLYLRQEGRGIGLVNKLRAYQLQDTGLDTVEANHQLGFPDDLRDYRVSADMLAELGISRVRLMTNNPRKLAGLIEHGIQVIERLPLMVDTQEDNVRYLRAKQVKLGHLLDIPAVGGEC